MENLPSLIYISYSAHDAAIMQRLQHDLRQYHFTIAASINAEALQRADYVLVVLSPEAAYSQTVRSELATARQARKRIISLLARGETEEVAGLGFKPHQWIDLRQPDQYEHNLSYLLNVIAKDMGITLETWPTLYMAATPAPGLATESPAPGYVTGADSASDAALPSPKTTGAPVPAAIAAAPTSSPKSPPVFWIVGAALLILAVILVVAAVLLS